MLFRRIGCVLVSLIFLTPVFAKECPPADQVISCSGGGCTFQRLAGWSETVFFTDQGKPFLFQKKRIDGREIRCYYSYLESDTHRLMPPALMLRSIN